MDTLQILHYLAGPVVGAVIGYCTNYIAVKMLFKPNKPVLIGKFRVPFTPGIIPKRKADLAKSIGQAVGNQLLTTGDLQKILLGDEVKNKVVDDVLAGIKKLVEKQSICDLTEKLLGENKANEMKNKIDQYATERIFSAVKNAGFGDIIAEKAGAYIGERMGDSFFAKLIGMDKINAMIAPVSVYFDNYIEENGIGLISPLVQSETKKIMETSAEDSFSFVGLSEEKIRTILYRVYDGFIEKKVMEIVAELNIAEIVQSKIDEMSVAEIEKMVLSVMKKELNAIVNLGALIGFVIGILMVLF